MLVFAQQETLAAWLPPENQRKALIFNVKKMRPTTPAPD